MIITTGETIPGGVIEWECKVQIAILMLTLFIGYYHSDMHQVVGIHLLQGNVTVHDVDEQQLLPWKGTQLDLVQTL